MRNCSFSATEDQILSQTKFVTRIEFTYTAPISKGALL